jgi:hypothetical protein
LFSRQSEGTKMANPVNRADHLYDPIEDIIVRRNELEGGR